MPTLIFPPNANHDAMYLYLGMATGAIDRADALAHLIESLRCGGVNRGHIEYLRDKLNEALKESEQ